MSDSQWRVDKEDWPVGKKSTDTIITEKMIKQVFSQVPKSKKGSK